MRRVITWAGGAIAAFLLVSVAVHLPVVQRAMGWTNPDGTGACPFGHGGQRLADLIAPPRLGPAARPRAVLGFTLGATTRDQILAWARDHGVTCAPRRGRAEIECTDVPAALLGGGLVGTSAWFEVDPRGVVRAIKTSRRTTDVAHMAGAFDAIAATLTAQAGEPARSVGSAAPHDLARGAFRHAMREYRLTDFRAVVRATNMGDGFVLTESYATL